MRTPKQGQLSWVLAGLALLVLWLAVYDMAGRRIRIPVRPRILRLVVMDHCGSRDLGRRARVSDSQRWRNLTLSDAQSSIYLSDGRRSVVGWALPPFGNLNRMNLYVPWSLDELYSAMPAHQIASQPQSVLFSEHARVTSSVFKVGSS
jgi:hypothetical protein